MEYMHPKNLSESCTSMFVTYLCILSNLWNSALLTICTTLIEPVFEVTQIDSTLQKYNDFGK